MMFSKWKKQEKFNDSVSLKLDAFDKSLQDSFSNVKSDVKAIKEWIAYLHQNQDNLNTSFQATVQDFEGRFETLMTKEEIKYFVDEYYQSMHSINQALGAINDGVNRHLSTIYSTQNDIFQRLEALSKDNASSASGLREEFSNNLDALRQEVKGFISGEITELSSQLSQLKTPVAQPVVPQIAPIQVPQPQITSQLTQPIFDRLEQLNSRITEVQAQMQEKPNTRQNLKEKIFKKVTRHSKEYVKSMLISMIKKYNKISGLNLREIVVEEQGIVSKSSFYRLLEEIEQEENIHVVHEGKEKHYFWNLSNTPEAK